MAFETNADGSTKRIFLQLSGFNGFTTIDFATHTLGAEIKFNWGARGLKAQITIPADPRRFTLPAGGTKT